MTVTIQMAEIDRPGDVGIDLPAGSSASMLHAGDYQPVDMELRESAAVVWRPGDVGIDLPAGACATALRPADYRPIEMEPEGA